MKFRDEGTEFAVSLYRSNIGEALLQERSGSDLSPQCDRSVSLTGEEVYTFSWRRNNHPVGPPVSVGWGEECIWMHYNVVFTLSINSKNF